MPPKKSQLNAQSREAQRKRVERAKQAQQEIEARIEAQRIMTAESRGEESQEQCGESLPEGEVIEPKPSHTTHRRGRRAKSE